MNQQLITWLVRNMLCCECPVYEECQAAKPNTCESFLTSMFRASDDVLQVALRHNVATIRAAKRKMLTETDPTIRLEMSNRIAQMRKELRQVREYIGRKSQGAEK